MELIITLLTAIGNFLLSLFVYSKNSKNATNLLFTALLFFLGLYPIFNYLSLHAVSNEQAFFWSKLVLLSAIPAGPLFYCFVRTFPDSKLQVNKKLLLLLSIWSILNIVLASNNYIFSSVTLQDNQISIIPGPAVGLFGLLQLLTIVGGSVALAQKYRLARGLFKLQLQYITYGLLISFGLTLLATLILPLVFNSTLLIPISPFFLFISSVSISYSILRHRLLDIHLVVARTVSYVLLVSMSTIIYAVLIALLPTFFATSVNEARTIAMTTVVLSLFMSITYQPIRRLFEHTTDRFFYKDHYDTGELLYSLTQIMASTLALNNLMHLLLKELLKEMRVSKGAFILTTEGKINTVIYEGYESIPEIEENKLNSIVKHSETLIFDELPEGEIKEVMRKSEFSVVIRLHNQEKEIGVLVLGNKLSGDLYTADDIKVLEIFAPEVAVAIQNAKSYEEIQRFNITLKEEVEHATKDLQEANEKLKQLDKLKDEFVSLASHELRTPMTAIKSYLWLFMQNKNVHLEDKDKQYIERAYASTDRLIALVNDMLNVSRIEAGRLDVTLVSLNPIQLARDVVEELKPAAEKLHVTLSLSTDSDQLPNVMADQNKLKEVLINLIGNALKFTNENGTITVKLYQDKDMIVTQVIDNGKGIKKEDQQKLFQKFTMLNNNHLLRNGAQGTGLGLYITKSIIGLHGGTIWVESEGENKGTTFSFTLKIDNSQQVVTTKTATSENHEPIAAMMTA